MFCIRQRKNLQWLKCINVPNIWPEQDQLVSYSTQIKTLNSVEYFMGWYEHFHLLLGESKGLYGALGPKFPWLPAEALPGCVAWQRCTDTCSGEGEMFLGQQKVVVSKLCFWLLASCQIYRVLLGLLKWEKMSGGAFWAYWKLLHTLFFQHPAELLK